MRAYVLALMLSLMVGCSAFVPVDPESTEQELAYLESQVTAVTEQAIAMRKDGEIDDENYAEVVDHLKRANRVLDTAWVAVENDESIEGRLHTLEEILANVQEELQ